MLESEIAKLYSQQPLSVMNLLIMQVTVSRVPFHLKPEKVLTKALLLYLNCD